MSTEEKIKLYEELHPEGKKFPQTKKPNEKPEDMQWLDDKIAEFQKQKDEEKNQDDSQPDDPDPTPSKLDGKSSKPTNAPTPSVKITTVENKKIYTVDQIKGLPEKQFKEIEQLVNEGKARVVNNLDEVQG